MRPLLRPLGLACLLSLSAGFGVGCGSDGAFGTSVPPETALDDATPEQLQEICSAVLDELYSLSTGPLTRSLCTAVGVGLDSPLASCETIRDGCISEAEDPVQASCTTANQAAFDACDTTVGEMETCMRQFRANMQAIDRATSCNMTREQLAELDFEGVVPELCSQIAVECPALGTLLEVGDLTPPESTP